jgi:hypothetical protein
MAGHLKPMFISSDRSMVCETIQIPVKGSNRLSHQV